MFRYIKLKLMPKTLKYDELSKLQDLYYYNYKYLTNPVGSPYSNDDVKKALKIVNECINSAVFNSECDLYYQGV